MLDDDNQNVALGVLAGVVALVVAAVIALAIASGGIDTAPIAPEVQQAVAGSRSGLERVYFEVDSADLPVEASEPLVRAAEVARRTGAHLVISGFHDASGDAQHNAELAKQRALTVRHALEADGRRARATDAGGAHRHQRRRYARRASRGSASAMTLGSRHGAREGGRGAGGQQTVDACHHSKQARRLANARKTRKTRPIAS